MRSEGFYVNEKSNDTSWDRTRDLTICSTLTTVLPRSPIIIIIATVPKCTCVLNTPLHKCTLLQQNVQSCSSGQQCASTNRSAMSVCTASSSTCRLTQCTVTQLPTDATYSAVQAVWQLHNSLLDTKVEILLVDLKVAVRRQHKNTAERRH